MALSLLVFFFPQELAFPLLTVWLDRDRHQDTKNTTQACRKSVPGLGQGTVCRSATKSKHCPGRKYTLSVLLSNKGVNEKSLSQLMTSGEHGQRYQLPSTGAPGRKKNLVFSIPLGEVFNKFAKKKSDCLFISVVINLSPNARAMVSFHANFWRTEAWLCPTLPLRGHSVSHILLLSTLFVGPLKENKEEAQVRLCVVR